MNAIPRALVSSGSSGIHDSRGKLRNHDHAASASSLPEGTADRRIGAVETAG
jgi:hypothetical protein